jgi:hypothetical protein
MDSAELEMLWGVPYVVNNPIRSLLVANRIAVQTQERSRERRCKNYIIRKDECQLK